MAVTHGQAAPDQPLAESMRQVVERLRPLHLRLCPRQVLGARIGLLGGEWHGLALPRLDKRLLAIVETDGCFVDGVAEATGCRVGRRTMRVMDHGKVAAVFVDVETGQAVRVRPHPEARQRAVRASPAAPDPWHAQLDAYQRLASAELLIVERVALVTPLEVILGRPGVHVECAQCGEEIMNVREVHVGGQTVCKSCAGDRHVTRQPDGSRTGAGWDETFTPT